ncbi:MAG: hypothetical protein M3304_01110 [Actinomycetota bacterium]|nr:hypothetical protein [Actinomycetota bacterium]
MSNAAGSATFRYSPVSGAAGPPLGRFEPGAAPLRRPPFLRSGERHACVVCHWEPRLALRVKGNAPPVA